MKTLPATPEAVRDYLLAELDRRFVRTQGPDFENWLRAAVACLLRYASRKERGYVLAKNAKRFAADYAIAQVRRDWRRCGYDEEWHLHSRPAFQ